MARAPLLQTDPERVGRYRLVARLGAGGMGVVYLAETADRHPVAVKVLRPELADDPEFRTRFGREVATLTRVQGVCTVRVIEADTQAPKPFLVTEYADGPSLSEYAAAHGPLDPGMLYGLATGLAEALTAIHAAGIVHRDLKPSNVLLTASGPKVIDFGIAQALDTTSLTRTGITVGSAGFMAPEQIMGRAGTAADIFTWAVTVAFAASGQAPFGSGASDAIMYRIMHAAPDISAVPPGLRPLVEAALAKDPQARPTAPQLLAQLTSTQLSDAGSPYDDPTRTVLAQTWHAPRPARPAPCRDPPDPAGSPPGPAARPAAAASCSPSSWPWPSCWPPGAPPWPLAVRAPGRQPRGRWHQQHADPPGPGQHHRHHDAANLPGHQSSGRQYHDDPARYPGEHCAHHRARQRSGPGPGAHSRQLHRHEAEGD